MTGPFKFGPRVPVSDTHPGLLPMLDHDHDWVDTTELQDDERIDICAAGGCSAIRTVPR